MKNKINYSREMEKIIASFSGTKGSDRQSYSKGNGTVAGSVSKCGADHSPEPGLSQAPRLLLHSCCAPCSSHCMEYLREYFAVTVFYYNPNITVSEEYEKRLAEEKRLIAEYNRQVDEGDFTGMRSTGAAGRIDILEAPYDPDVWFQAVRGLEDCPEGGNRCTVCFELRLRAAARAAAGYGHELGAFDYFTTTLTISPLKDADRLNEIGRRMGEEYGVEWLPSDFKKRDGYKRSIELSGQFGLYRQNYCGCVFSRRSTPVSQWSDQ